MSKMLFVIGIMSTSVFASDVAHTTLPCLDVGAFGSFSQAQKALAEQVAKVALEQNIKQFNVEEFLPQNAALGASLKLRYDFVTALKAQQIEVNPKSKHRVTGQFLPILVENDGLKNLNGLKLLIKILEKEKEIVTIAANVESTTAEEITYAAVATSGEVLPPLGTTILERRDADITLNPADIRENKSLLCASSQSPFCMAVISTTRANVLSVEEDNANKMDVYNMKNGEEFLIELTNKSDRDAVVDVNIDGISTLELMEGEKLRGYLVKAQSKRLINGWYIDAKRTELFRSIPKPRDQIVKFAKNPKAFGTINAVFRHVLNASSEQELPNGVILGGVKVTDLYVHVSVLDEAQQPLTVAPGRVRATVSARYKVK